jgi:hypothetical protein
MKTVVIAKFNEDTSWMPSKLLEQNVVAKIVHKIHDCPNVGREPFSFLWYIISQYDKLEGEYYFVQGNPFDHCPNLFAEIEKGVDTFKWLGKGEERYVSDHNGNPHHGGLPVGDVLCRLTNVCGINHFTFTPGGQFAVTAEIIKKKPLYFYLLALTIMAENFESHPWCFERIWERIFT